MKIKESRILQANLEKIRYGFENRTSSKEFGNGKCTQNIFSYVDGQ